MAIAQAVSNSGQATAGGENSLSSISWLVRRLSATSSTKAHITMRDRRSFSRALAKGEFLQMHCKVAAALFGKFNLKSARWRAIPVKDELPALAVLPGHGFGVLYGQSDDGCWLLDAPTGKQRLKTIPEGAAFASMQATALVEKAYTAAGLFKRVFDDDRNWLFQAAFASLIGSVLALGTSLYSMQVYDRVISTGGVPTLIVLCFGVSISILIELAVKIARAAIVNDAIHDIDVQFGNGVFERLLRIRLDQFPANVGTLAAQVRGFETVRSFKMAMTQYLIADAPFAVFFVIVIFMIAGPALAAVPAVAFVVAIVAGLFFKGAIENHSTRSATVGNRRQGFLVEAIHGAETLKSTGGRWGMLGRWTELSRQTSEETISVKRLGDLSGFVAGSIQQVSYVALITLGAWLAISGSQITMGAIIACSILSGRVLTPINMLPGLMVQWGHAQVALKNLEKLFELECENHQAPTPLMPEHITGAVQIKNAEFAYAGQSQPQQLSALEIKAGDRVAVIGAIGAGKSTLLKMMAGLCKPQRGHIFLDGLDIYQIDPDRRSEVVGYLPQKGRLFAGALRDNLSLGLPDVTDERIVEAAEATGLADVIKSRPEGLDLPITEGGEGLSGGQAQQVALTRMLLSRPALWLLDEPTASMDDVSELRCVEAIKSATLDGQTLVLVTHKMRLLDLVSRVIVVTPQGVVLDGPKEEVLKRLQQPNKIDALGPKPDYPSTVYSKTAKASDHLAKPAVPKGPTLAQVNPRKVSFKKGVIHGV